MPQHVLDYLRAHRVMTVATIGPEGPAAAAVFYASEGLDFCFLSAPDARHSRNLRAEPRVAVTIQEDYADWRGIRGVQLIADARELAGEEESAARALYAAKFPGILDGQPEGSGIPRALAKIRWYGLRATWVRFIDNSRGFGHREEWSRAEFLTSR